MDRNLEGCAVKLYLHGSLSARRAWIEILVGGPGVDQQLVALRKESVDRNSSISGQAVVSAVALRKESVDRNLFEHLPRFNDR